MAIPAFRVVPLKMLPYDNKNEFQILVDMPEGSTLEQTEAATEELARYVGGVAEVRDYQLYAGLASAMDFNGMVRHYFLRQGPNVGEIRVNLAPKSHRRTAVARHRPADSRRPGGVGGEVRGEDQDGRGAARAAGDRDRHGRDLRSPDDAKYDDLIAASRTVAARMEREPDLVDVDVSAEDDQTLLVFEPDKPKAALSGVSTRTSPKRCNWP